MGKTVSGTKLFEALANSRKGEIINDEGEFKDRLVGDAWGYGVFTDDPEAVTSDGWDKNRSFSLEYTEGGSTLANKIYNKALENYTNGELTSR